MQPVASPNRPIAARASAAGERAPPDHDPRAAARRGAARPIHPARAGARRVGRLPEQSGADVARDELEDAGGPTIRRSPRNGRSGSARSGMPIARPPLSSHAPSARPSIRAPRRAGARGERRRSARRGSRRGTTSSRRVPSRVAAASFAGGAAPRRAGRERRRRRTPRARAGSGRPRASSRARAARRRSTTRAGSTTTAGSPVSPARGPGISSVNAATQTIATIATRRFQPAGGAPSTRMAAWSKNATCSLCGRPEVGDARACRRTRGRCRPIMFHSSWCGTSTPYASVNGERRRRSGTRARRQPRAAPRDVMRADPARALRGRRSRAAGGAPSSSQMIPATIATSETACEKESRKPGQSPSAGAVADQEPALVVAAEELDDEALDPVEDEVDGGDVAGERRARGAPRTRATRRRAPHPTVS